MEASALQHTGVAGRHPRSPLLRLAPDERLIALIRRGNDHAFEALVARYQARLLSFCRHMLRSREDAEDVLQEVFAAAYNAIHADTRALNVRPWLYRIARNRSLNHLRRAQPIGVDSMDVHLSEHGQSAADKVHKREDFQLLIADVRELPETQRTALLLREMEGLSYEQISVAMDTTVPAVKSLLVRARVSLAEASEARLLSCEEVRTELGETAEGLRRRLSPPVRRHLRGCDRCRTFKSTLRQTNRQLAALYPIGPLLVLKNLALAHFGTSAASGGGAAGGAAATGGAASCSAVATSGAAAGSAVTTTAVTASTVSAGSAVTGALSVGAGTVASKAAAGMAAAALVTAGAVEVKHVTRDPKPVTPALASPRVAPAAAPDSIAPRARAAAEHAALAKRKAAEAKVKSGADGKPGAQDGATGPAGAVSLAGSTAAPAQAPALTETGADTTTLPGPPPPLPIHPVEPTAPEPEPAPVESAPPSPDPAGGVLRPTGSGGTSAPAR